MLKSLLYQESHSDQFGTSLTDQINNAFTGIAIGQKVIDEQHFIFRLKKIIGAKLHHFMIPALFPHGKDNFLALKT